MGLSDEIKVIEQEVVDTLVASLDKEAISEQELPTIADYVLTHIDNLKTKDEIMPFLRQLSEKWRIFTPLLVMHSGEIKEKQEGKVAKDVLSLAQLGRLDQAIKLAKTMTDQPVQST